jgi:hypothetical protein
MVLFAFALLAAGLLCATLGARLAKLLLPLFGLFAGVIIGFTGVQAVFGTGVLSTTVAVFVSFAVGILMAVLSYVFFDLAVTVLMGLVVANALAFLGIALGLRENGFVVFMLYVAGLVMGIKYALRNPTSEAFLIYLTSLLGVAMVLSSVFLISGDITLAQLADGGVLKTISDFTSQSFLWLLVWFGGALVMAQVQIASIAAELGMSSSKK